MADLTNCCEHGDHLAPEGKRFCSDSCRQCEISGDEGCIGLCAFSQPAVASELAWRDKRIAELEGRRRESRQLLHRMVKYVIEDRAKTPGKTRLARLTEQVRDYLDRTHEPKDILR